MAAVILAVLSSFYLINSIGMMSHTLCALLSEVACLCLFRGLATGRLSYFSGMFTGLGFALQVRPNTAFVLAAVMTVAALWETRLNPLRCARVLGMGLLFRGPRAGRSSAIQPPLYWALAGFSIRHGRRGASAS